MFRAKKIAQSVPKCQDKVSLQDSVLMTSSAGLSAAFLHQVPEVPPEAATSTFLFGCRARSSRSHRFYKPSDTGTGLRAGKLTFRLKNEGKTVMMAAGDTFRAAAVEQLEKWAERTGAEFVKGAGVKSRPSAGMGN